MRDKFRLKEVNINGYYFLNEPGLFWHSGKFWYDEKEVKQVFNNGSLSVLIGNKKLGVKKLRKNAKPCVINIFT